VLYHKPINAYAYCHASASNHLDYYSEMCNEREKWMIEVTHSHLFNKVFVATEYHRNKLLSESSNDFNDIEVVGFPRTPLGLLPKVPSIIPLEKKDRIISVARMCKQKVDLGLEYKIEKEFGKIERASDHNFKTWQEYMAFINDSKIMIITSQEETFGVQVMDAIENNCIPIAPRSFSFPELLPSNYLYNSYDELSAKIHVALKDGLKLPTLQNKQLIDDFYKLIAFHMGVTK